MKKVKVLVVDDSLTMRALISGLLEKTGNVTVVGTADGAVEARQMIAQHNPDVITLDIEMPGVSGIQLLEEIMNTKPMPVIMFSTLTEKGAQYSKEALRLGSIGCFPKPRVATPTEIEVAFADLGATIQTASERFAKVLAAKSANGAQDFSWNGRLVAIGVDEANSDAVIDIIRTFPGNGPPTLVVQHAEGNAPESFFKSLGEAAVGEVVRAASGTVPEQGKIYFAGPGECHIFIDKWPEGQIRLVEKAPIGGRRPSMSFLFAALAKVAPANVVGVLLVGGDADGGQGIKALQAAGGHTIRLCDEKADGPAGFELGNGGSVSKISLEDVSQEILNLCRD